MLGLASGCASTKNASGGDRVRVVDGVPGKPIAGASIVVIYPAGACTPFKTDENGFEQIQGGFAAKKMGYIFRLRCRVARWHPLDCAA